MLDRVLGNCTLKDNGMISVDGHCLESQPNRKIRSTSQERLETYRRDLSYSLDVEEMELIVVALAEYP